MKNFSASKGTINKVKKQPIEMNKIFANYLPVMKSIFEIFSELLKVNNKTNNSNQKQAKS